MPDDTVLAEQVAPLSIAVDVDPVLDVEGVGIEPAGALLVVGIDSIDGSATLTMQPAPPVYLQIDGDGSLIVNASPVVGLAIQTDMNSEAVDVRAQFEPIYVDVFDGPTGPQGPPGPQGSPGVQGPPGAPGNVGPSGPQGAVGPQGPQGEPGTQGSQGEPGTDGATGATGPKGDTGDPGPKGDTGSQGPMGPQGEQGEQGSAGTGITMKGSVPTAGELPPVNNEVGDAYIVEADDHLWVWDGTQWVDGGSIQGPPGAQGPQGPQGVEGTPGAPGPKGDKGDTGDQGAQGFTGERGAQGDQGVAGPIGPQGPIGATGPQGDEGPQGVQGVKGDTGDTGATGAQGPQGIQGPTGATGAQGDPGQQGPQGPKGDTGAQGPVGPGIAEAPSDGKIYGRKDATWSEVSAVGNATTFDDVPPTAPAPKYGDRWIRPASMTEMVWAPNTGTPGAWINPAEAGGVDYTTKPFKLYDGTVAAPGLAWASEPTLGWYRHSAGLIATTYQGVLTSYLNATAATDTALALVPRVAGNATLYLGSNPNGAADQNTLRMMASPTGYTIAEMITGAATAKPLALNFPAGVSLGSGQLKFPAAQNASADANTLDDYEEGTWTPTNAAGVAMSPTSCIYTKVGRVVTISGFLTFAANSSSADIQISGIPFAANGHGALAVGYQSSAQTNVTVMIYGSLNVYAGAGLAKFSMFSGAQLFFGGCYQT